MKFKPSSALISALILGLAISGCEKPESTADAAKYAAKVNGEPIVVTQLEKELEKLGQIPSDQMQEVSNKILKSLIDRQLLAQQAMRDKLEADARVRERLAEARNRILAEARVEALTGQVAKPAEGEIKDYFDKHPELFALRRIYRLQELHVQTTPENAGKIGDQVRGAKNLPALATALQAAGVPVRGRQLMKSAEELPTEMLAKLASLQVGQSLISENPGRLTVVVLAGADSQPVTLEQATPAIEQYLLNARKRDRIEAELESLRKNAKIEYQPPYGPMDEKPAASGRAG